MLNSTRLLAVVAFVSLASTAWGQALVVIHHPGHPVPLPRPITRPTPQPSPASYKITKLAINGAIEDQVAKIQVSQEFQNTGSRQMEVSFVFPLPYDGAIDSLTLMVDGKEFPAQLLEKDKAREIYESIVRSNKDPALLEWIGNGMFKTSVFPVPAGAKREVNISFSQLLKKDGRLTDFMFPLSTAQYTDKPIEEVSIRLSLQSSGRLKNIYSPTHEVDVSQSSKNRAVVEYTAKNNVPSEDFRLFFDSSKGRYSANLISYRPDQSDEGYFLMLASPSFRDNKQPAPKKTVLFVVDRSGSMSGKKMEQAREAAKFVLNNLDEKDLFNIIAYDSDIESFKPELQSADRSTVDQALGFVDGLYSGGSTNIDGALSSALGMVQGDDRPCYVLFLTDGKPTNGVTDEMQIVEAAKKRNRHDARIINFGVGYDVNSRLLDRLSRACNGQSQYVRPNEDLEEHVSRLYRKINAPVLSNVEIQYDLDDAGGNFVNRLMPEGKIDLFAGQQLIQVGRYRKSGNAKITIKGKVGNKEQSFDFPAKFVNKSRDQSNAFVEKLWAVRRIGEIIDEMDLNGRNEELMSELVQLSTKHGVLTPYTSFLADENQSREELADARRGGSISLSRLRKSTEALEEPSGRAGFAQRALKQKYQNAKTPLYSGAQTNEEAFEYGANAGARGAKALDDAALNVQNIGNKSLFRRNNVWFDQDAAEIDLEAKDKYETVERFSSRYFELVTANTKHENRVLSQQQSGEMLMMKLRGKYFLFR